MKGYKERKNMGAVKAFALAELVGFALSLVLLAVLAVLIGRELLPESAGTYAVHAIRTVGVFVAALIAGKQIGCKYALVCAGAAGVYMLILIGTTVLFFDSRFDGFVAGLISSIIGAAAACAICMIRKGRGVRRKRVL